MKSLLLVLIFTLAQPSYCFNMQWLTNHLKAQSLKVALCTSTAILGYLNYKTKKNNEILIQKNNALEKYLKIFPPINSFRYDIQSENLTLTVINPDGIPVEKVFSLKKGELETINHRLSPPKLFCLTMTQVEKTNPPLYQRYG
jgi:hypothetical protein